MATLVSEITILSCTLMTMIVSLISQVFQDGSTYRGRLKLLCRVVVKACYEDMLQPNIVEGHNLDQAIMIMLLRYYRTRHFYLQPNLMKM